MPDFLSRCLCLWRYPTFLVLVDISAELVIEMWDMPGIRRLLLAYFSMTDQHRVDETLIAARVSHVALFALLVLLSAKS